MEMLKDDVKKLPIFTAAFFVHPAFAVYIIRCFFVQIKVQYKNNYAS